jgi:hypothetical protein
MIALLEAADGTRDVCFACYGREPRRACGVCGQVAAIHVRGVDGSPDVCVSCYRPPIARCSVCGTERPCSYAHTDTPVCWSCKPRRIARCADCGEERPVKARSPDGPICERCNWRRLRAKAVCDGCGALRRPATRAGDRVLCGDCTGIVQTRVCERCGTEDLTYDRGLCPACSLSGRLDRLRGDDDRRVAGALEAQLQALAEDPNPLSVLQRLRRPAGRTLGDLLAGRLELSHAALDGLERGKGIEDLRARLVQSGCLPVRDETQALFDRWLAGRLAQLPPGSDATAVRTFAVWKVSRELAARRRRRAHRPAPLAGTMPRRYVIAAIDLIGWLHAHDLTLDELDQPVLEQWLTSRPANSRRTIRPFIAWWERQDRRGLRVPAPPSSTPHVAIDDAARLAAVGRLLDDGRVDARLRLAGCLVALYAQPVARIVGLTADELTIDADVATVRLGRDPVVLPPALRPVAELVALGARGGWLFPGQRLGHPIHPQHLAKRLRDLGVPPARTRPAGLAALAHRIPAPVLADLLGLSASTVCATAGELKVDYSRYVARRT